MIKRALFSVVIGSALLTGCVAAPASAVTLGEAGPVNCRVTQEVAVSEYEAKQYITCDWRTTLGIVIHDAHDYSRTVHTR